ncbi:hypothetical protein SCE1572_13355 [Sorangium cellulosum So0157-2]|uniref:Uncharacterized protein n=1 Tax=Sorangium cellulosum So0157-2 TaxID=1254432 RepID=S4XXT1_SORCE|nr:hypothetical protein SCE1572_13355 [Sorangium cellulosum So0157-2]
MSRRARLARRAAWALRSAARAYREPEGDHGTIST